MAYFLSPALAQLRAEVNALWPGRDKASDGWIGDLAHASRASDHNPDGDGSVNAFDFDKDGIDVDRLRRAVMADRRANYVIWSGTIYRRANGWRPEKYAGINGHYHHVHVSILHGDTFEDDHTGWGLAAVRVSNPIAWTGAMIPATQSPDSPAPLTPEDDMTDDQARILSEVHAMLGAGGAIGLRVEDTIGYRVRDVQAALTTSLPVLLASATAPAVVAAIPDDIAREVADLLIARLAG